MTISHSDKIAGSPDDVHMFLKSLASRLMKKALKEKQLLLKEKLAVEGGGRDHKHLDIQDWDIPYYMGMLKARHFNLDSRVISNYFPLFRCLEGLDMICSRLFNVNFKQVEMDQGESWHKDVMKMELRHKSEGLLGIMYLDLYPRVNKYNHAAHFTVSCGRKLEDGSYQTPVVALVTNFARPPDGKPPRLS